MNRYDFAGLLTLIWMGRTKFCGFVNPNLDGRLNSTGSITLVWMGGLKLCVLGHLVGIEQLDGNQTILSFALWDADCDPVGQRPDLSFHLMYR